MGYHKHHPPFTLCDVMVTIILV